MADLFVLSDAAGWSPGFETSNGRRRRVLRNGGAVQPDGFIQLVPPSDLAWARAQAFDLAIDAAWLARHRFQSSPRRIVATSRAAAKSYVEKWMTAVADTTAGAAKDALGYAMAALSTRPLAARAKRRHAQMVARRSFEVRRFGGRDRCDVTVEDRLVYAADALRGGEAAVGVALMKAANKISGRLTHALHRRGDFEHDFPTPFPEVKRRK